MYGHLAADATYDNLFHIAGCDQRKSLAVDFDFSEDGFNTHVETNGYIQVAFSYTSLTAAGVPTKRLRVLTCSASLARRPAQLYGDANAEAVMALVTHQTVHATLEAGTREAKALLEDWLIGLAASYTKSTSRGATRHFQLKDLDDGKGLLLCDALRFVPRFVFVLLKHQLLAAKVLAQS